MRVRFSSIGTCGMTLVKRSGRGDDVLPFISFDSHSRRIVPDCTMKSPLFLPEFHGICLADDKPKFEPLPSTNPPCDATSI
jgi:hypothetical protein